MIVCTECGHQNDDGDGFCGSCGTYLEWSGERIEAPTAAAEPPGAPRDRTIVEKAKEIVGLDPDARAKASAAEEDLAASEAEARAAGERQARSDAEVAAHQADEAEQAARHEAAKAAAEQAAAEQAARVRAVEEERARQRADLTRREADEAAEARRSAEMEAAAAAEAESRQAEERARRAAEEATNREVAAAQAQAALQAEEQALRAAEERARTEAEAVARAEAQAEEARQRKVEEEERARRAAEEEARARAEAEERAARASALIARTPELTKPKPGAAGAGQPGAGVDAAAAGDPGPAAVKPGAAARKRAPVAPEAPKRAIRPGDLICGQCGEPNDAGRRFCRRCGHSLQEAVVAKVPWWRRPFVPRRKPPPAAGTRRVASTGTAVARPGAAKRASAGARRGFGFVMKGLIAFGALVLLIGTVAPVKNPIGEWRKDVVAWVKDRIDPQYEPVRPDSATATSAARAAENAIDGLRNTSWAAEGGDGVGQVLVLRLARPTDLDRLGITSGASEGAEDFAANPRPERVRLLFSDGSSKDITLKDTADFQTFTIDAAGTTEVRMQIVSAYPGTGPGHLAIAEVELFGQQDRR